MDFDLAASAFLPRVGDALPEPMALPLGDFSTEGEGECFVSGFGDLELLLDGEGGAELFIAVKEALSFPASELLAPDDLRPPTRDFSA